MSWQPIKTAPKDAEVLLWIPDAAVDSGGHVSVGRYNTHEFAKRPRPRWKSEREWLFGSRWGVDYPATHWMPLPEPPK